MTKTKLKKTLKLWHLIFYGVGTMLGAGIYVLIGKVAGVAGFLSPAAFLFAAILAGFTAFSFAELAARYPKSAGIVVYVQEAFKNRKFSIIIGYLMLATGIISTATMLRGFSGYFQVFFDAPEWGAILAVVAFLTLIAIWGISQSITLVTMITLVEIGGLIWVVLLASGDVVGSDFSQLIPSLEMQSVSPIVLGAFLAFYAYIGFEDLANIAEEAIDPQRNLPIAFIASLLISTLIYMIVAIVVVLAMPIDQLAASDAPLADLLVKKGPSYPLVISAISMVAVMNGALVQIIMGSRVLYGMSEESLAPKFFYQLHHKFQTPVRATILVASIIAILALFVSLVPLAEATSFIIILLFFFTNLSLYFIKKEKPNPTGVRIFSQFVPIMGMLLCGMFMAYRIWAIF